MVPLDAGQEGAAMGVDEGVTAVDEVLELEMMDEEMEEMELAADDEELGLDTIEEETVTELEGMVEVLKEVMEGVVVELSVLELLTLNVEEVLALAVILALVDTELAVAVVLALVNTELDVVVIGRMYPATLVLRR
jgi:hypothetical protein